MKYFLYVVFACSVSLPAKSQYNYLSNLEPAIGQSRSGLITYLRNILGGKEPTLAPNSRTVYTIGNVDMHAEYSINNDSCLQAGIKFFAGNYYHIAEQSIVSACAVLKDYPDVYYKTAGNGRTIYYVIDKKAMVITLYEKNFFNDQLRALNHK